MLQATVQQMWKHFQAVIKVEKALKLQEPNSLMFCIELVKLTFNKWSWNGDGCMVASPPSKVSSLLPGLGDRVPGEDRGEEVTIVKTTGDE